MQQRFRDQCVQHALMARLGGSVGEQQPAAHAGIEAHGKQRRDRSDKAIHQHRNTVLRGGDISANKRCDFKTADTAQSFKRTFIGQIMQRQRAGNHVGLVRHAMTIQPGAGTG